MRFSASVTGVIGVVLTLVSLVLPWVMIDFFDMTSERTLMDYAPYLGQTYDAVRMAYSTALYMIVIGLAVSVYSLLGGLITLAGASVFTLGGIFGDNDGVAFGSWELTGATVHPGIGLYVGFTAAVALILAIVYPLEVSVGKGGPRPKYRTWHAGREEVKHP